MSESQTQFNIVVQSPTSTVVAEYIPAKRTESAYQSEDELEKSFIKQLQAQAYEYLPITNEQDLIANLRGKISKLNNYDFSDKEWEAFFKNEIAKPNSTIIDKTTTVQEDHVKILIRDDCSTKNIYLLDKESIHNNCLQVINQYSTDQGQRTNRYDVTILVNGLPIVHVELKRRGVAIQEAFNQINRYQRESFWAASGLFEFVQLFVISNGTHTKYYSNTTRNGHINELKKNPKSRFKKSSNSFEFTSWWADANNEPIIDLMDFCKTFFAKHSLLNVLLKYCVFTSEQNLLVMRPYQIVATERIMNRIEISTNYKKLGTTEAGGFVWHTTGSGKTLTSFKTALQASQLPQVKKVLFVVDRKDLDYQTMKEYDKFQKGAADSSVSTSILKKQLEDSKSRIIITTIQKLDRFIANNKGHTIFDGHVVLIFDECHRSQFGEMHASITKIFKNYNIFGFTGTPIFAKNSSSTGKAELKTTEQVFGHNLHTYSIVNAIADKNVLPFKIDYISTIKAAENIDNKKVNDIDRERVLAAPERIANIVEYIRTHFDQKTKRNSYYELNTRRLNGFNSIFAVSSIEVAKKYYLEFQKQIKDSPSDQKLKIATIFSYGVNEDVDNMIDENSDDTIGLDISSKDFLDDAIVDYNKIFSTSYDTSSDKFSNYYKDISKRMKNREIDILIVVNMFLTGFDSTTINTLWVDKNLKLHGLLQAFSRTNRILNSIKTFGNVVCFRNLEKATNESLALFGDKNASGIVLLKSYIEYYNGYQNEDKNIRGYKSLVEELISKYPVTEVIIGEQNQKEFVKLYNSIVKVKNILTAFDDFDGNEIISFRDYQDYQSKYYDIYDEFRKTHNSEKENIVDDIVFEMELIKQIEINIDYILQLIKKYHENNTKDKEILIDINKAVDSSISLRNKKDLINHFINNQDAQSSNQNDWDAYIQDQKTKELEILIKEEDLNLEATNKFIKNSFRDGMINSSGTDLSAILPPITRFSPDGERTKKIEIVLKKLKKYFDRFFDISSSN